MDRIKNLISSYIYLSNKSNLHKLRKECRKYLSYLEYEGFTDLNCKKVMKLSSKVRSLDVLGSICKKDFSKKREKNNKKLIKFLKKFEYKRVVYKGFDFNCEKLLKNSFIPMFEEELHKIRVNLKKCRYVVDKRFKKLVELLGKMHDMYECEIYFLKKGKKPKKIVEKKFKYLMQAEEERKRLLKELR